MSSTAPADWAQEGFSTFPKGIKSESECNSLTSRLQYSTLAIKSQDFLVVISIDRIFICYKYKETNLPLPHFFFKSLFISFTFALDRI